MLVISDISVSYGKGDVIRDFSMEISRNKIYSIIGPSGCGKTTLFKTITGILQPNKGRVTYDVKERMSIMMQNDVLLPWRTVKDNIRLGTELTTKEHLTDDYIKRLLYDFGVDGTCNLYPRELSAGMKQRVSLIQAIVSKSDYLFLDEPFSNLDFDIKLIVQKRLLEIHHATKNTIVFITHDIEDAIALSDFIVILTNQPTKVRRVLKIDFGDEERDPVIVRTDFRTPEYFNAVWSDLKYYDAK